MKYDELSYIADDGKSIHVHRWTPERAPKALLLVAHGMAEHGARYARLAENLIAAGYELWAPDHRGHGRTAAEGELGWLAEQDGFRRVVDDLGGLAQRMRADRPGAKLFLLGHSWGSLLSQGFISVYGDRIDGCVLSASTGIPPKMSGIGALVAAIGGRVQGWKAPAKLADKLSFGEFNKPFEPGRTAFDWLSRDEASVDAYINDPLCGFVCTWEYFRDIIKGLKWIYTPSTQEAIPKKLPVFLFTGTADPIGGSTGGLAALADRYRDLGLKDVRLKLYEGARHETLNETNREEVMAELRAWLDGLCQ